MIGNDGDNGKYTIVGKEDPLLSKVVPEARRRICRNTKIPESARMFFCWLTDMSLTYGSYIRKGVYKISDGDVSAMFRVNPKTVRNWKRWIESTGEVWLTERWTKNSFPQTVYNITAIVGQATLPSSAESEDGTLPDDQVFSSNRRRQQNARRSENGKFVCREHGMAACQICRRGHPPVPQGQVECAPTSQISQQNGTVGKILPPATAIDCRPPRQMIAAHHGNSLPSPTANGCRPARQMVAAHHGNDLPRSTANGFRAPRQTVADNRKTRVGELSVSEVGGKPTPTDLSFEASLKGMFPSRLEKLRRELQDKLLNARSEPAKAEWRRRLVIVKQHQLGGAVPDQPAPKPGPARKAPEPARKLSKEEFFQQAMGIIEAAQAGGFKPLLTEAHRAALKENGVTP